MIKAVFLTVVMLLSMISFAQTEKLKSTQTTFGRYGSDCSSGRGACSFTVSTEAKAERLTKKSSENNITLEIKRALLTSEEQICIAGQTFATIKAGENPKFVQQEPLILDNLSLKSLDINPLYNTIQPGNYPMLITKDKVIIVFTLSSG